MIAGSTWKERDVLRVRALRERGLTYAEVAAHFPGRTLDAIRWATQKDGYKCRKGINKPKPPAPPPERDELLATLNLVFERYANDNGLTPIEAKAVLLSGWQPRGVAR